MRKTPLFLLALLLTTSDLCLSDNVVIQFTSRSKTVDFKLKCQGDKISTETFRRAYSDSALPQIYAAGLGSCFGNNPATFWVNNKKKGQVWTGNYLTVLDWDGSTLRTCQTDANQCCVSFDPNGVNNKNCIQFNAV